MYIAMNRFRIQSGHEEDFERVWRDRETYLDEVPGFVAFQLLRGPSQEDETHYVSHSSWESEAAFDTWRHSEAFKKGHARARTQSRCTVRELKPSCVRDTTR